MPARDRNCEVVPCRWTVLATVLSLVLVVVRPPISPVVLARMPRGACARPGPSSGVGHCRTEFANAHGTVFRELLYPWHPWCGLQVVVHEAVTRADVVAFRCTLTGSGADRWLGIPAWM